MGFLKTKNRPARCFTWSSRPTWLPPTRTRISSGCLIKLKQIAQVVADCSRVHEAKMFVARRTFNNALELFCSFTSAKSEWSSLRRGLLQLLSVQNLPWHLREENPKKITIISMPFRSWR
jgi:hypothetical protein